MIAWPAVIKFEGNDELTFVNSSDAIDGHPELANVQVNSGDVLIDSAGKVFKLQNGLSEAERLQHSDAGLTLDAVIALVRRHASVCGECCISKISAPTIGAAIALVKAMQPE